MASNAPRGRFAPSPTGELHLGNLRTALLAWLSARAAGGQFLVRIEDLDRVASSAEAAAAQLNDLAALGLDWDGTPVVQSERFDRYHAQIDRLVAGGDVFECFCTRREIAEAASAPHGTPNRYPGTCRDLDPDERDVRRQGRPPALRIRADRAVVEFDDLVLGPTRGAVDDLVIRRNDGVPAYNLVVVVDDAAQGITEVVRGDDLATSTPGQIWLARRLGLGTARYGHVPLVLGADGSRLAKRHGAVTLGDLRAAGVDTVTVLRALARSCGLDDRVDRPSQLVESFDLAAAARAAGPAVAPFVPA